ncbi:hypothetical protein XELAEV_18000066mg [Xenopus laevis]|uniref:Uncharacterized protein n=1 Tax=Xenopus laevis TaxID=8355 RepID=A0A974GYX2_XENLA|nr:hypothetical protein XELAEV_18000066mg [Xenopus laevis]
MENKPKANGTTQDNCRFVRREINPNSEREKHQEWDRRGCNCHWDIETGINELHLPHNKGTRRVYRKVQGYCHNDNVNQNSYCPSLASRGGGMRHTGGHL